MIPIVRQVSKRVIRTFFPFVLSFLSISYEMPEGPGALLVGKVLSMSSSSVMLGHFDKSLNQSESI